MASPATTISVRPRALEWLAPLLFPPVCCYAAYVALAIVFGVPASPGDAAGWHVVWRRALLTGGVLGCFAVASSIHALVTRGYWRLDEAGLTRGRFSTSQLVIPWSDIDAAIVGMPDSLPLVTRLLARIPTAAVQASIDHIRAYRAGAIVLRLRGRRLFAVNLGGRQHSAGAALMAELARRCAPKLAPASTYTPAERRALARHRFHRVLQLGE